LEGKKVINIVLKSEMSHLFLLQMSQLFWNGWSISDRIVDSSLRYILVAFVSIQSRKSILPSLGFNFLKMFLLLLHFY